MFLRFFVTVFYVFRCVSRLVAAVKVTDLDFDWLHAILARVGKLLIHYALTILYLVRPHFRAAYAPF